MVFVRLGEAAELERGGRGVPHELGTGFPGGGRLGVTIARYGAVPAAVYLMFRYTSLINATLTELGAWPGVTPWLVQFVFWFLALSIALRLALFLLAPLSWLLCRTDWLLAVLAAWVGPTPTRTLQAGIRAGRYGRVETVDLPKRLSGQRPADGHRPRNDRTSPQRC